MVKKIVRKRGQVWIETVIYTLIAFVMIGLVLAYAKPKIEAMQDKVAIDQALLLMEGIDQTVISLIQGGQGNKRRLEIGIDKGTLNFDGVNDLVVFNLESEHKYSEPGKTLINGIFSVLTNQNGKYYNVSITRYYVDYDLRFEGTDDTGILEKASTPYVVYISNNGENLNKDIILNVTMG